LNKDLKREARSEALLRNRPKLSMTGQSTFPELPPLETRFGDNARIEKAVTSQSATNTCPSSRPLGNYQLEGSVGLKMITTLQLPTGFRGPRLLAWLATVICKHS
jgi:hypothetical protein